MRSVEPGTDVNIKANIKQPSSENVLKRTHQTISVNIALDATVTLAPRRTVPPAFLQVSPITGQEVTGS